MRAAWYSRFGPAADVIELGEMDTPRPGPGEVRVKIAYSGVNPSDAKARGGTRPGVTAPPYDRVIPHSDGAGVIDAVGDGIDAARIGQPVWLWNAAWQRPYGTAAEYVCLPEAQAVAMPDGLDPKLGAVLGIPGLTAAQTVFGGGDVSGQTVLVSGGAGAVGHNAVQLAKWGGARVIATCSKDGMKHVHAAGADAVFDYSDPDLAAQIDGAAPGGIDRAVEVEFGVNAPLLGEVMKPMGTIAAYGSGKDMTPTLPFGAFLFKALKVDITLIYLLKQRERDAIIARLHAALTAGALAPAIDAVLPLAECAKAHEAVMTPGRTGAVLLEI
ncbi:NADPH2:quinone reductase [Roseovarius nanhaiticus]|uniref:NADPH2:quinone reductase n=1 Tax=Roseovarius nanhaiticus TaxID=573024 RepID=A0A1N7G4C1_9RHOB|nr:NADPH:quinone reductase [Roseovarius nanhaiticus]SEK37601.1 NADPH2:quinone reductase [Roseovarius nanhaiticus]SIS07405.1 NADPH2:quinone reductase [Roseovarius nanhaiticus]